MRGWVSFRTPLRGVRLGTSMPLSTRPRTYRVSAEGRKVWRLGSAVMLIGLAAWLFFSRGDDGRLNENFLLVIALVLAVRWIFKQAVASLYPPIEAPTLE